MQQSRFNQSPVGEACKDLKSSYSVSLLPGKMIMVAIAQPHTMNQGRHLSRMVRTCAQKDYHVQ